MKKEHYELILNVLEAGVEEHSRDGGLEFKRPPLLDGPIAPSSVRAIVLVDDVAYSVTIEAAE